jgi:hypothetical protein
VTVPSRRLISFALPSLLAVCSCRAGAPPTPADGMGAVASPQARIPAIAERCARIASCAHPHDPPQWRNPSACVDFWVSAVGDGPGETEVPGCLSSARTCGAVRACLHPSRSGSSAAFCRAHPGAMTGCDGTALVSCGADDPEESTALDCASLGAKCGDLTQAGGLSTHACVDPARCSTELTSAWCSGTRAVVSCHEGEIERTPCKAGTTCREHTDKDGEHVALCEGSGHASCTTPGKKRCDKSTLVECETHGHFAHEHAVDCATTGLGCSLVDGGAACTSATPACMGGHATCEGNTLAFCAAGVRVSIDCNDIGLGPCEADGRGLDATCRPSSPSLPPSLDPSVRGEAR